MNQVPSEVLSLLWSGILTEKFRLSKPRLVCLSMVYQCNETHKSKLILESDSKNNSESWYEYESLRLCSLLIFYSDFVGITFSRNRIHQCMHRSVCLSVMITNDCFLLHCECFLSKNLQNFCSDCLSWVEQKWYNKQLESIISRRENIFRLNVIFRKCFDTQSIWVLCVEILK